MKETKKGNNEDTICWQCLAARLVCSVDCWTLKSKMNNTFHSNNEKTNSARHNISCFLLINLVGILFSFYFSGIVLSMENHERAILVTTTGECLAKRSRLPKNCKRLWTRAMPVGLQPIREFLGISRC